ncbi:MAG: TIGR03905 family TSCPD domain-containing protein [Coriobacteriia bacterium]|nr:TIGR03905 family TSCPD domain-containing protein [Coriobacteriia bacterium]
MPSFIPSGVCSSRIDFEIDNEGLVKSIRFSDGCPGNAAGLSKLAENHLATELIELFEGLTCGHKPTSCPDQLSKALKQELQRRL